MWRLVMTDTVDRGDVAVVQAGQGESYWQPVPANGFVEVKLSPRTNRSQRQFALGTQSVTGTAVIDGVEHPVGPGTTLFLGAGHRHKFINTGAADLVFLWCITPNGLEDFFAAIGRPRTEGAGAPEPFARPAEVLAIEAATGFVGHRTTG
jgi:hypothetical protein